MKNTMKIFLVIALFSSMAFAEGDMGAGNKTCPQGQTCLTGDMGAGNKTCPQGQTCLVNGDILNESADKDSADSIFDIISAYLDSIF